MINVAVLMGRLTADPDVKLTNSGITVANFTLAVERAYVKAGEERQTDFIDVVAWRQTADFISRYFSKGNMIAIQGAIQTRNYTDKEGNKRKAFEILAEKASFCGENKNAVTDTTKEEKHKNVANKAKETQMEETNTEYMEDLPF